jgi:C-terminal processing protease CtpA/Prc
LARSSSSVSFAFGDSEYNVKTRQLHQNTDPQPWSGWHGRAVLRRVGATLAISLLMSSLHGAESPSQDSAKLPPIPVFTRAEMVADLEHLTVRLKRAWAYAEDKRTFLGVDIDALHAAAMRQLDEVHDADGFYFVVEKYISGLMDGHASVRPGHASPGLSAPNRWPFEPIRLDGHFYVKALDDGNAPLRPGDEILSVNGVSLRDRFETALARSTGSTPAGRESRAVGTMRRGAEKQISINAARPDGSSFTCELATLPRNAAGGADEEPIHWKNLEGNVGYLRLPSFVQDMKVWEDGGRNATSLQAGLEAKKTALRQAFAELRDTRAMILDLRGNGGGSDALGHFLAHFLCDTAAHPVYYTLATRISEDLLALPEYAAYKTAPASARSHRSAIQLLPEKGVQRYQGNLVVLMDEGCFSACDCFLNYLSVAVPNTVFVGRPNGAGAGAPRPLVTLPHSKMVVTFCIMQVWNLNDQLIESRPLKPTVPVKWTRDDSMRGRDPDIEAALRHL